MKLTLVHLQKNEHKLSLFDKVRIWSGEHQAWWGKDGKGYYSEIASAGIYTIKDAYATTSHCCKKKKIEFHSVDKEELDFESLSLYEKAKKLKITDKNRWETGIPHHPMSVLLFKFLEKHDYNDNNDSFCWKSGGDGDNGETLMYQMDAFFETLDLEKQKKALQCLNKNVSFKQVI